MDPLWLNQVLKTSAIIVPTRSLSNILNERIAANKLAQGEHVWEAPNILLWQDYLSLLWQLNRDQLSVDNGAQFLLSNQQSLLLWTQIIQSSRRRERELTLLNVQQTARAVQRSWRLMNDWQLDAEVIAADHVADGDQFLQWIGDYQALLKQRGLIDLPILSQMLAAMQLDYPFQKLTWYHYDLLSDLQKQFNRDAELAEVEIEFYQESRSKINAEYHAYPHSRDELIAVLEQARKELKRDPEQRISIVVPDLQHRHAEVQEQARIVFYPQLSPLALQRKETVYRFSLGQALSQWGSVEAALRVIRLLNNQITVVDLGFLLRNPFLHRCSEARSESRLFEQWLKQQRLHRLQFNMLPEMLKTCLDSHSARGGLPQEPVLFEFLSSLVEQRHELQALLEQRKTHSGYAALSFIEWAQVFSQWLQSWGWRTEVASSNTESVEHQLQQRWLKLIEEFAGLSAVQKLAGLSRATELLQQMARDAVFLPQAVDSPIFISGVYESIGRPADRCFLLGMDQNYPATPQGDPFLPNRLLKETGYPNASVETSFKQAQNVIQSLLNTAKQHTISYAQTREDSVGVVQLVSPLFRNAEFEWQRPQPKKREVSLETYQDIQGPAWDKPPFAKNGASIFQNQSECEFKAFVTHQLRFDRQEESEFGLDARDQGSILHAMLDRLWAQIQSSESLAALSDVEVAELLEHTIETVIDEQTSHLSADKFILLQQQTRYFESLLHSHLLQEKKRHQNFTVVEREEQRSAKVGGIQFSYIIDRLDLCDDGRTLIVDYKSGMSTIKRSDWVGERLKQTQLPLYAVALDAFKRKPVAGIAVAKIKRQPEYQELCETDIVRTGRSAPKTEQSWLENRPAWEPIFAQLADDFLNGKASVNPIDEEICRSCDLGAVCRVRQLRTSEVNAQESGVSHED